jgi:hypothetical protein
MGHKPGAPLINRLLDKVEVRDTGYETPCWLYQGAKTLGYGRIQLTCSRTLAMAHRVAYELFVGPIPNGLDIDHLCRNPSCVNPTHLEPVTAKVNAERGERANRSHCPHGHPYDEANTYWRRTGGRGCRACRRVATRQSMARRRER